MEKSKIIYILKSFTDKELKKIKKFLLSPYFNEDKNLTLIYDLLTESIRDKKALYTRQELWNAVYPETLYDDNKFRFIITSLVNLTEQFIAHSSFDYSKVYKSNILLREFNLRKLDKCFNKTYKSAILEQELYPYYNADYFYSSFLIDSAFISHSEMMGQRFSSEKLQSANDNLDKSYIIRKLKLCCALINFQKVLAVDFNLTLIDEIINHVQSNPSFNIPTISIYLQIILILRESENESHYFKLKKLLDKHSKSFPGEDLYEIYVCSQNYCIQWINKDKRKYYKELFYLYKNALRDEVLYSGNFLSPWHYKNIITVGLRLNEFDWTENFIRTYKSRIAAEYRENAYVYNLAKFHFRKQEYSKVIKLLQKVKYDDVFYSLDSRATLMKTYYETGEFDALDSLITSFRVFLSRNKTISDQHKRNYLNLIKFLIKAIKILPEEVDKIKNLKDKINETKDVADKQWLLNKVDQLNSLPVLSL